MKFFQIYTLSSSNKRALISPKLNLYIKLAIFHLNRKSFKPVQPTLGAYNM